MDVEHRALADVRFAGDLDGNDLRRALGERDDLDRKEHLAVFVRARALGLEVEHGLPGFRS